MELRVFWVLAVVLTLLVSTSEARRLPKAEDAMKTARERCMNKYKSKLKCNGLRLLAYPIKMANAIWLQVSRAYTFVGKALKELKNDERNIY